MVIYINILVEEKYQLVNKRGWIVDKCIIITISFSSILILLRVVKDTIIHQIR
jgi:hypothetical protein